MPVFEELFEALTDKEKQQFSETVNLLLGKTYLVYEREQDRLHYRFVERHLELFRRYLEMARWSVHLLKQYGVIQAYNMDERNRRSFSLQETIFLLIMRLLYDEKRRDLRLTEQVLVTGQDIQEKYLALQVRHRLPAREDMQRILKLFGSFSLLDLKRGHWKEPEAIYVLYPSLLLVLNPADMESLAEWLRDQAEAAADLDGEDLAELDEPDFAEPDFAGPELDGPELDEPEE